MPLSLLALPILALLALAGLCLLLIKGHREMSRLRVRRILRLAVRLRAELVEELDRLEVRNRVLGLQIGKAAGRPRSGPLRPVVGPDLIEALHEKMILDLRGRTEQVYQGLRLQKATDLERQCRALDGIIREVALLASEIDGREKLWSPKPAPQPAPRRSPAMVEAA